VFIATAVLATLLAAGFVAAGLPKVLAQPAAVDNARQLGYSLSAFRLIGLLELSGSAGLLIGLFWAPLGVAAAAGLALLVLGAVITHLRRRDPVNVLAPAVVFFLTSVVVLVLRLATA
jgi:uncharacterized membrane protein YphA (DoxX/SURF4 family)